MLQAADRDVSLAATRSAAVSFVWVVMIGSPGILGAGRPNSQGIRQCDDSNTKKEIKRDLPIFLDAYRAIIILNTLILVISLVVAGLVVVP